MGRRRRGSRAPGEVIYGGAALVVALLGLRSASRAGTKALGFTGSCVARRVRKLGRSGFPGESRTRRRPHVCAWRRTLGTGAVTCPTSAEGWPSPVAALGRADSQARAEAGRRNVPKEAATTPVAPPGRFQGARALPEDDETGSGRHGDRRTAAARLEHSARLVRRYRHRTLYRLNGAQRGRAGRTGRRSPKRAALR